MRKTGQLLVVASIYSLLALTCSSETADPPVYSNAGDTVRIAVEKPFKIQLESNATTGYSWRFSVPFDSSLIELVSHQYVPRENPDQLVGRGGHEEWLFRAVSPGSTSVSLQYLQPWDSSSVAKTVEFQVEIAK